MRLLLDTHAIIWHLTGDAQLSRLAREAMQNAGNQCFVSVVAIWKIAIKVNIGKIQFDFPFDDIHRLLLEMNGFHWLPTAFSHLQAYARLPLHHRDPFDRMLLAQAQAEGFAIVSRDPNFPPYGLPIIW